eukprot:Blabericola_migrator_1__8136@NODE_419_length_8686_cov_23_589744_g331_i0_p5_GENE_NODE_419_length_8686_cov_23_589744_g331_i0NODE_419_length_8686_cov_23_589744_g331_i0_p5_ORF_typecomplete_len100_score4_64_NODE_419_length_8686_cov_23_589744_g331_i083738672
MDKPCGLNWDTRESPLAPLCSSDDTSVASSLSPEKIYESTVPVPNIATVTKTATPDVCDDLSEAPSRTDRNTMIIKFFPTLCWNRKVNEILSCVPSKST